MAIKKVAVHAGQTLFEEGDTADAAYLVESGSVEITSGKGDGRRVLAVLGEGDIVGEMAIIDGLPRSATATALSDSLLTEVSKETLLERVEHVDDIIVHLLWVLISRLRAANGSASRTLELPRLRSKALDELMVDQAIRDGLRHGEFVPYLQPIVRLRDECVVGYEALARWQKSDGVVLPPGAFVGVAERTNAIKGIDICILEGACAAIGRVNDLRKAVGLRPATVSVNLSGVHFTNSEIVGVAESAMAKCRIPARFLRVEVTETVLLSNPTAAAEALNRFRDLGVGIYLDDFGTGYSNLASLNRLPIDKLKIDRSFVQDSEYGSHGAKISAAIVALTKSLGLETIAEGIETVEQTRRMVEMGCDYGQGYLFGKPMPEEAIVASLRDRTAAPA